MNKTLIAIPCYNEEESLPGVLRSISALSNVVVCVINDGSTDNTAAAFEKSASGGELLLDYSVNLGISSALVGAASLSIKLEIRQLLQCDGDGQHPLNSLADVLNFANELHINGIHDFVVIGSRFLDDSPMHGTTRLRIMGSKILRFLLNSLYQTKFTDPTSGLRLYSGTAISLICTDYPLDWPEPIFIGRLQKSNIPIFERSTEMAVREHGISKIRGIGSAFYMIKMVVLIISDRIWWTGGRNN